MSSKIRHWHKWGRNKGFNALAERQLVGFNRAGKGFDLAERALKGRGAHFVHEARR